eukprot:6497969-Alexandrium_andersonii.AAC.1
MVAATSAGLRAQLKKYVPRGAAQPLRLMHDFRGLGAHLNTTQRSVGITINERIADVKRVCRDIKGLPATFAQKCHLVQAKALPAGLYGCAATPIAGRAMASFRTAVAAIIDGGAALTRALD